MVKYLKKLPKDAQELIRLAGEVAALRGMAAYLIGGCVRDLLLGVKNLDLDIAVEGDGIIFAEDLAARLKTRIIRHRRFGTATVVATHDLKIDVASSRKETYPEPAALPEVSPGPIKEDLKRRDFTINAMAIDINAANYGRLVDFFHGRLDLSAKKIRILHKASFIDDPTRLLRAVRFEKRYNFRIEPDTLKLFKAAVKKNMLNVVQPQRLRDELILMLKEKNPIQQLKRLYELAGLSFLKEGLKLTKESLSLLSEVEKEIKWYERAHSKRRPLDKWLMYFIVLLEPLSEDDIRNISLSFALRKGEEKRILSFKGIDKDFISELATPRLKPSRIFQLLEPLSYEVTLLIKAKHKHAAIRKHVSDFLEIYNGMRIYISGTHLRNLGIEPGPVYQQIFTKVLEAKLNGIAKTESQEMELIKELVKDIS